jgi:hypothetical protein
VQSDISVFAFALLLSFNLLVGEEEFMDVWGRFDLDLGQRDWLARGGVLSSGQIRLSFET